MSGLGGLGGLWWIVVMGAGGFVVEVVFLS